MLTAAWQALQPELADREARFVKELIAAESEEKRGRIKELLYLLELPQRLQQELSELEQRNRAEGAPLD